MGYLVSLYDYVSYLSGMFPAIGSFFRKVDQALLSSATKQIHDGSR